MNDISALRAAVREAPVEDLSVPDIDAVMRGGRRLRCRRRLYGATALGVVAGVATVLTTVAVPAMPNTPPQPATSAHQPTPSHRPDRAIPATCVVPSSSDDAMPRPVGDIIRTGIRDSQNVKHERVFYVACRARDDKKGGELVVITALRHPDGTLRGSERTHGIGADGEKLAKYQGTHYPDGYRSLPCGYYIGPATRIVGVPARGPSVTAGQATWSEDPDLVVFWFDARYAALPFEEIRAYDAEGKLLSAS